MSQLSFDCQLCELVTFKPLDQNRCTVPHLKIHFISVWSQTAKGVAWLLIALLAGQSTLKSYHKMQIDREWVTLAVNSWPVFTDFVSLNFRFTDNHSCTSLTLSVHLQRYVVHSLSSNHFLMNTFHILKVMTYFFLRYRIYILYFWYSDFTDLDFRFSLNSFFFLTNYLLRRSSHR